MTNEVIYPGKSVRLCDIMANKWTMVSYDALTGSCTYYNFCETLGVTFKSALPSEQGIIVSLQ